MKKPIFNKKYKKEIDDRKSKYKRLNHPRYLMVTFDLKGSKNRKWVYSFFEKYLGYFLDNENSYKIIKQCYFVKSNFRERDVREEMQNVLEKRDSILVARLQPGHSYSLKVPGKGTTAKTYFSDLKADES